MNKVPKHYWTLFEVIRSRVVGYIESTIHKDMLNPVFGLPMAKPTGLGREPTKNEAFWIPWLKEFSEINSSVDRLTQSLVYLSNFPASKVFRLYRLSEADWLRYHIEAYLQEVYILRERLGRFLKKLERVAIHGRDKAGVSSTRKLGNTVEASLKNVVTVRGGHVHQNRFEDDALRDLGTLVLLTRDRQLRPLRVLRQMRYLEALIKWRKQIFKNNRETQSLCIMIFQEAASILQRIEPK